MPKLNCLVEYPLAYIVSGVKVAVACGPASSGKSTLGRDLEALGWQSASFASPLKAMAGRWFGIPAEYLDGPSEARRTPLEDALGAKLDWRMYLLRDVWQNATSPDELAAIQAMFRCSDAAMRLVLDGLRNQLRALVGQPVAGVTVRQVLQVVGTDWARAMDPDVWVRAAMREAQAAPGPVVFTDGRFRNEAQAVQDADGVVMFLDAGDRVPRPPVCHVSEPTLDTMGRDVVDYVVDTSGPSRVWHPVRFWVDGANRQS